ncbi:histone-lysine N-methyltransferase, partial [Elysia marginata]
MEKEKREKISQENNTSRETDKTDVLETRQDDSNIPENTAASSGITQPVTAPSPSFSSSTSSPSSTNISRQTAHPGTSSSSSNTVVLTVSSSHEVATTPPDIDIPVLTLSPSKSTDNALKLHQRTFKPSGVGALLKKKQQSILTLSQEGISQDEGQELYLGAGHSLIEEADLQESIDAPCLLPETSGFVRVASRGLPVEYKRGRGRPRKEGLNPLQRKPASRGSRGLGRPLGRPFGTRGGGRGLRGAASSGRGSRGGRRGRPPYPYLSGSAGFTLLRSPSLSQSSEGDESPSRLLSPPPPGLEYRGVTSPPINQPSTLLSPLAMADVSSPSTCSGLETSAEGLAPSTTPGHGSPPPLTMIPVVDPEAQVPEHMCSLCNCGERSLLGQGDTWRYGPSPDFDVFKLPEPKSVREGDASMDPVGKASKGPQPSTWRRSRGPMKTGRERSRSPRQSGEIDLNGFPINDELASVGFPDDTELSQIFEPTGHFWVHKNCALWSTGVTVGETHQLEGVDKAVYEALSHRCAYCRRFGATVVCCIPECGKRFHFPCAAASGCFQ